MGLMCHETKKTNRWEKDILKKIGPTYMWNLIRQSKSKYRHGKRTAFFNNDAETLNHIWGKIKLKILLDLIKNRKCSLKITRRYYSILIRMAEQISSTKCQREWSQIFSLHCLWSMVWVQLHLETDWNDPLKGKTIVHPMTQIFNSTQECVHVLKYPATVEEMAFFYVIYLCNGRLLLSVTSCVPLSCNPMTVHAQASPSFN